MAHPATSRYILYPFARYIALSVSAVYVADTCDPKNAMSTQLEGVGELGVFGHRRVRERGARRENAEGVGEQRKLGREGQGRVS